MQYTLFKFLSTLLCAKDQEYDESYQQIGPAWHETCKIRLKYLEPAKRISPILERHIKINYSWSFMSRNILHIEGKHTPANAYQSDVSNITVRWLTIPLACHKSPHKKVKFFFEFWERLNGNFYTIFTQLAVESICCNFILYVCLFHHTNTSQQNVICQLNASCSIEEH